MANKKIVTKGSTKSLYESDAAGTYVLHFRDEMRSGDMKNAPRIEGKGILNNRFSEFVMNGMRSVGIPTHLVRRLNMREQLVHAADPSLVRVRVRNYASASFARRYGIDEGGRLSRPVVEFYLRSRELNSPMVTEEHLSALGYVSPMDLDEMVPLALRTNDFLTGLMTAIGVTLIDMSVEVGRIWEDDGSRLVIVDEISPESCSLIDTVTERRLSGPDTGLDAPGVFEGFREVAARLKILPENGLRLVKTDPGR